ncbi:pumilio homolog 12-like [Henckelia pumila]|uniref:pumilio homolog 12-like n=1 Tax=Henckelia pumila TaxID=405737 RepID=UPI003C6E63AB
MSMYGTLEPAPSANSPSLPPVPQSLEDWKGELFWKAMDLDGYRSFWRILEHRKPEHIQLVFSELKNQICPLMFDRFGGSVIICLSEVCDEPQMNELVSSLVADAQLLMLVCLNSNGYLWVLKFVERLRTPEQMSDVISALQPLVPRLVKGQFGHHVIGHFFDIFPKHAKETQPLLDAIADTFFEMGTNPYGYPLLSKLLRSKIFLLENQPSILSKLIADVHQLSHDTYGCLVVQDVIELGMQDVQSDILAQLRGNFALMSMHKDAQCVVSALIMESQGELAPQIYNELTSSPNFSRILQNPSGKDVIELALTYIH